MNAVAKTFETCARELAAEQAKADGSFPVESPDTQELYVALFTMDIPGEPAPVEHVAVLLVANDHDGSGVLVPSVVKDIYDLPELVRWCDKITQDRSWPYRVVRMRCVEPVDTACYRLMARAPKSIQ